MKLTSKQTLAIAGIVIAGALAAGALLLGGHGDGHDDHDHDAAEQSHDEPAGHDKEPARHVDLDAAQVRAANITVEAAGPAPLRTTTKFQGEIRLNEDRTAHIVPRVAGVVDSVHASLGQAVRKGQLLAVLTSSQLADQRSELLTAQQRRDLARSAFERERKLWQDRIAAEQDYLQAQATLQEAEIAVRNAAQKLAAVGASGTSSGLNRFEVRAPFDGTVVEKHLALGEAVKDDTRIFTVSDLRAVWAEFVVAPKDLAAVRTGQSAEVSSSAFDGSVTGTVAYVGSLLGETTRTATARVALRNPDAAWRPGLFVTVAVAGAETPVPLAVSVDAVQTHDNETLVFVAADDGFVGTPVTLGRTDGRRVEVLSGLKAGDRHAATNTFVLKSELGKSGAAHSH